MDIFRGPNTLFNSVSDAESNDIKILTGFPGSPILEILIKNLNCVGGTNMRRRFLKKLSLIAIHNCPMIFGRFFGEYDFHCQFFDSEKKQLTVKNITDSKKYH